MSVRFTNHMPEFKAATVQKASIGLRLITEAIVAESDPHTPKKHGFLRRDILKFVLGLHGEVHWKKRYAAAQEAGIVHGRPVKHYTTPGTGPHYAENAVRKIVANAAAYFQRAGL